MWHDVESARTGMVEVSKLLTVHEAARRVGLSEYRIRELIREKEIRATKIKRWRIAPEDLEEFVRSRRNK
jgi:excisionase family DNA binding protein